VDDLSYEHLEAAAAQRALASDNLPPLALRLK